VLQWPSILHVRRRGQRQRDDRILGTSALLDPRDDGDKTIDLKGLPQVVNRAVVHRRDDVADRAIGRHEQHFSQGALPPDSADFLAICRRSPVARTPGVGVFVTGHPDGVPPVLRALVERVRVLPETVVLLTMEVSHVPRIIPGDGGRYDRLADGFHRLVMERGYLDQPDVPAALARACRTWSIPIDPEQATFYLGRATFIASSAGRMGHWSESLFAFMARNSRPVTDAFCIPPARVVEIDSRIDL